MNIPVKFFLAIATCLAMTACNNGEPPAQTADTEEAAAAGPESGDLAGIARDAYVYGFPLVMNQKTIYQYVIDTASGDYKGPFNEVACEARLFTPTDTAVVTPNADTPYCMFWLDLRAEPYVLSVPRIEAGRYYSIQLIDFYTHNFAYVGTRINENAAGDYLLSGPGWDGDVPDGITEHLPSETDFVFAIVRIQLFGADDIGKVADIQEQICVRPLSEYAGTASPPELPAVDFRPWVDGVEFTPGAFDYLDFALDLVPSRPDEVALRERFAEIGIGGPGKFRAADADPELADALAAGAEQGLKEMRTFIAANSADPLFSARIFGTRDFLQREAAELGLPDLYLPRAAAALAGLYGNSGAEAIYPAFFADSDGEALDASVHDYVLTFADGEFPPVKAFWSLSMYDGNTQLFVENPLDRYLLNSRMTDEFVREEDGTVRVYIQHDAPRDDLLPNWLPAPDGPFYVIMRLYLPLPEALAGNWNPPPIVKSP